jgi:hypothetical protein
MNIVSFLTGFTLVHVIISLIGIGSGVVVVFGLLTAKPLDGWTAVFLASTLLTSLTGFGFPFVHLLPSHVVGLLSIVVLGVAILARYTFRLAGAWRAIYTIGAVVALYFNVFVLIVQLFQKVPALKALAPTQSEPPFAVTQLVVLALFVALGIAGVIKFRPEAIRTADELRSPSQRRPVSF